MTHLHSHLSVAFYRKSKRFSLYLISVIIVHVNLIIIIIFSLFFRFVNFHYRCSLWLKYGILANETTVILVNAVGSTLFFCYFIVFWMFSVNTSAIYRQFFSAILVLGLVLSYTEYFEENRAEAIEVVGKYSTNLDDNLS